MRVQRKARCPADARTAVLSRFEDPWEWLDFEASDFAELPISERRAFIMEYPGEFAGLFEFERYQWGPREPLFQRWNFVAFLADHKAVVDFTPPTDLEGMAYAQKEIALTLARAKWWVACRWPLTNAERAWLRDHAPTLGDHALKCPSDRGGWDQAHAPTMMRTQGTAENPEHEPMRLVELGR